MPRPENHATFAPTSVAFGINFHDALVAIDHLKVLVRRLGETYEPNKVDRTCVTPSLSPQVSPRTPSQAITLLDPDKIDVIDDCELSSESKSQQDACMRQATSVAFEEVEDKVSIRIGEAERVKIRNTWVVEDLLVTQSLLSAQKKIRYSSLKRHAGATMMMSNSFLGNADSDGGCVMHPQSKPRLCWTLLSLIFVAWDVFTIPLHAFKLPDAMSAWGLNCTIAIFWTVDILMNFRTGVFREGLLIMSPSSVARIYAFSWLLPDAIIVIVEWVVLLIEATRGFSLTRMESLIRCVRFLRVVKLRDLLGMIEHRLPTGIVSLFLYNIKLIVILVTLVHFIACSWYALGEADENQGWTTVENVGGEDVAYRYFLCARWTLAQINGRTDLQRRTMVEYAFTCVVIITAFILISLFISGITNAMMQINTVAGDSRRARQLLSRFLDERGVSAELAMDVKMCYRQRSMNLTDGLKIQELLDQLPKPMLFELLKEVHAPRLKAHDLFMKLFSGYPMTFRHICAEAVQNMFAYSDEVIFDTGEACSRMLVVDGGVMKYVAADSKQPRGGLLKFSSTSLTRMKSDNSRGGGEILVKGQWLTESALWAFWETRGRLLSVSACNMLSLEASDLARVLDLYKDAQALVYFYAALFVEAIHDGTAFSDIVTADVVADLTRKLLSDNASDLTQHVTASSAIQRYRGYNSEGSSC